MGPREYVYKNGLGLSLAFLGFFGVLTVACWIIKDEITRDFIQNYPAQADYADLYHLGMTGFLAVLTVIGLVLTLRSVFLPGKVILTDMTLIAPPKASSRTLVHVPYADLTHIATRSYKGSESVYLSHPGGKIKLDSPMFANRATYEDMRDTLHSRIESAGLAKSM